MELKGFGILCSGITNSKTFIAQRVLPGSKIRRVTVGAVNEIHSNEKKKNPTPRRRFTGLQIHPLAWQGG
jgi:hypothetical protein